MARILVEILNITWHGFPLKKMVNDLNEQHERQQQLEAFIPRIKNGITFDIIRY